MNVVSASSSLNKLPVLAKDKIPHAQLPTLYLAAKTALQECATVDELGEISNAHSALAHYAKQVKDDSLRHYAEKIHLRALRRIGELLRSIEPGTRLAAAKKGGIKRHEATRAVNISFIPKDRLDDAIEQSPPPSKSALSDTGSHFRRGRELFPQRKEKKTGAAFRSMRAALWRMVEVIKSKGGGYKRWDNDLPDPSQWALDLSPGEAEVIRTEMASIVDWLDEFDRNLPTQSH